jgi:hypothetical protein
MFCSACAILQRPQQNRMLEDVWRVFMDELMNRQGSYAALSNSFVASWYFNSPLFSSTYPLY